jgi:hypothetical protein
MKSLTRHFACWIACLLASPLLLAQGTTCICNGYNSARGGNWSFTEGAHFQRAVTNLSGLNGEFFGPSGLVNINVLVGSGVQFFSPIVSGSKVFITGLTSSGSYSEDERNALLAAVQAGMNLVITSRGTSNDISDLFDVSLVNDSSGGSLNRTDLPDHPIFAGPFGRIKYFRGGSNSSHFNSWPEGTLLLASNHYGPTMLFIPRGIFGSGSVLLIAEVDMLTTNSRILSRNDSGADVPVTDMLLMNIMAFLCTDSQVGQGALSVAPHLVFPQFANGENNASYLNLTHADAQNPVTATVSFRGDDGAPFQVTIRGMGSVSTFQVGNMTPNLTRSFATNAIGQLKNGWAAVRGSPHLSGNVIFFAPNLGATGVGASEVAGGFVLPLVQQPVLNTSAGVVEPKDMFNGLAICNLSPVEAEVRLELWNPLNGRISGSTVFLNLPPFGHLATFLFELYPSFNFVGFEGSLRVVSVNTLISVAGLQLGENQGEFTALPVAPIW